FEGQSYSPELLENYGLESYVYTSMDKVEGILPYVGYIYSPKINDTIFILPKVFLFEGTGNLDDKKCPLEIAFGKYAINEVIEITQEHNPLKEDGLDRVLFSLSTWIYLAIDKYSVRHPQSEIIRRADIRRVNSDRGEDNQTLLDTILSLIEFHKEHAKLFTYISIINSSGNNKIHWGKTISKVQTIIQNNEPFYAEFRNKNKAINYDEELIVIFYSVLEYLRMRYFFPIRANLNYELIKPAKIDAIIESKRGTKLLRSIRRKYFKDELVLLWKLLYAFFDKSETIRSGKSREEALLASKLDLVFEDMVDNLIGDDIFSSLKENEDGKEIDHIYKDKSLIDDSQIYYIGDSKYYFYGSNLDDKSIYKQFTYAKNIIQLNINIFNTPSCKRKKQEQEIINNVRYRDPLTEGYNLTPNFFIRGYIKAEDLADGHACYTEDRLSKNNQIIPSNTHFINRPFDRDTLVLQAYNINFLFVLASYITNIDNNIFKQRIHDKVRTDLLNVYNTKYEFFRVTPIGDIKSFVNTHFEKYIGKMYHPENAPFIWFAFEKGTISIEILEKELENQAYVKQTKLNISPNHYK
ncbi:MAG TPA: hypothetical protein DHU75_08930, partial [Rikenellaceae bacterium]|nr:hypothetical protein [Rikenellaceae bacterium]